MDQDFHYYGTYYAARQGGFTPQEATLIAKAANFIDFFNETTYAAYWKLVSDTERMDKYNIVDHLDYPRYTFQGTMSSGFDPEDGLWCSFHFPPGNYDDPSNTPSCETVHGRHVAGFLSQFQIRDATKGRAELSKYPRDQSGQYLKDLEYGKLLNRPQSALSRQIIMDAIKCATDNARLESILGYAIGGQYILQNNREDNLRRFRLILLGVRAHVIADTWAHQDFCGIHNILNSYWDVDYNPTSWNPYKWGYGRQSIQYDDQKQGWQKKVLSFLLKKSHPNFEAVPNHTSYLGHGWMGHLPDFSFVKFRYKPCWADPTQEAVVRNNPEEYKKAWVELVSLFTQAKGSGQLKLDAPQFQTALGKATEAINTSCRLEGKVTGRKSSADAWQNALVNDPPVTNIDVDSEPDTHAVLDGMIEMTTSRNRYGTNYVNINSDLYLFQIAADYHFHFVKNYLERHRIYLFTGSWSQQTSALSSDVSNLIIFNSIDPRKTYLRVRIKNIKSQRYLSIEGDKQNWDNDGASLTIRDPISLDDDPVVNPQVWHIIQFRSDAWIILNQYNAHLASIRDRSKDDRATAIIHHSEIGSAAEPFQQWTFVSHEKGDGWLIQNMNSKKYIGPQDRSTENDHFCIIQFDNQTKEDNYQLWLFEEV
ncbi:hypothetical protein QUA07_19515 [Microcoleus sp. T3_A4]|uniref:DUF6765 family protein n=1 Tax=Microcoleus sp. T3_A4 TaxID=2818968 RepID=UPI002FD40C74